MTPARLAAVAVVGALLAWGLYEFLWTAENGESHSIATPVETDVTSGPARADEMQVAEADPAAAPHTDHVRIERLEKIEEPAGPILDVYDDLALRANAGDAKAAMQLGLGLYRCRHAVRSTTDLAASIDRVRSRAPRVYYADNERFEITHDDQIASLQQGFDYCAGVSDAVMNQYFDWLVLGAELGLLQAQFAVAVTPHTDGFGPIPTDDAGIARMNELRATAMKWTHEAVAGGSVDAMQWLAMRYDKGILIEQDAVRAFAYMSAATRARAAAGTQTGVGLKYLQMLEGKLNTAQRNEAQRLATGYLADPACCKL